MKRDIEKVGERGRRRERKRWIDASLNPSCSLNRSRGTCARETIIKPVLSLPIGARTPIQDRWRNLVSIN